MKAKYEQEKEVIKVPRFTEDAGFYTTKQRSKTMAKIRAKNSQPEMLLRKKLWAANIRFRLYRTDLPGKPDVVIEKYKLVVFVDGDFWHGYEWNTRKPKTNIKFWVAKIERNMQRDRYVNQQLQFLGYTVMRFWEHQIKQNLDACVNQILLYVETAKVLKVPVKE